MEELKQLQRELGVNKRLEVTVWSVDNEELEFTFHSTVLAVDGTYFLVGAPPASQEEINRHMEKGLVVGIVLDSYPNPIIFYPIIHMQNEDKPGGYWLQIQPNCQIEVVQRRRHVRIPMTLPLEIEYKIGQEQWNSAKGTTEDVSGGGMRFTSTRLFPKDQELLIHIQFVDDIPLPSKQEEPPPLLKLPATVVFSVENRAPKRPSEIYSTACQFMNLTEQQEMIIMRECFKRELRLKVKR